MRFMLPGIWKPPARSPKKLLKRQREARKKGLTDGTVEQRFASLTPREREIVFALCEGDGTMDIADDLGIAHSTVDNHKTRAYLKIGVHKIGELFVEARNCGWLDEQIRLRKEREREEIRRIEAETRALRH